MITSNGQGHHITTHLPGQEHCMHSFLHNRHEYWHAHLGQETLLRVTTIDNYYSRIPTYTENKVNIGEKKVLLCTFQLPLPLEYLSFLTSIHMSVPTLTISSSSVGAQPFLSSFSALQPIKIFL